MLDTQVGFVGKLIAIGIVGALGFPSVLDSQVLDAVPLSHPMQLVLDIGGDNVPEDQVFERIVAMDLSRDNHLMVVDAGSMNVREFDEHGSLVRVFGRSGAGPGEFRSIGSLQLSDSEVFVWDFQQGRFSRFQLDGDHIQTTTPPTLRTDIFWRVHRLREIGFWGETGGGVVGADSINATSVALVYVHEMGSPDTLFTFASGMGTWISQDPISYGGFPGFAEPSGAWDVLGDSLVVVVDGLTGRFQWFIATPEGIRVLKSHDLHLAPAPIQGSERAQLIEHLRSQLPPRLRRRAARVRIGVPAFWAGVTKVLLNPNGETWFSLGTRGSPRVNSTWYILSDNANQPRSLEMPAGVEVMQVRGDRILAVAHTEYDSQLARVYRLDR